MTAINTIDSAPTTSDRVEKVAGATVQHGPYNRRAYLMKLGQATPRKVLPALLDLCKKKRYSKIFAKVPAKHEEAFGELGFQTEARVPRFFKGREDAVFLGLYLDPKRRQPKNEDALRQIRRLARAKTPQPAPPPAPDLVVRRCAAADIPAMAAVYAQVFDTYPFPISDPDFIAETMASHVVYFGVWRDGVLQALSSAETDRDDLNVEMTDFATLPEFRGNGYATLLLAKMEVAMRKEGIRTAYTIARAASAGMNITFAKRGYHYAGCLVNNTNICGGIESMNVWHRTLKTGA